MKRQNYFSPDTTVSYSTAINSSIPASVDRVMAELLLTYCFVALELHTVVPGIDYSRAAACSLLERLTLITLEGH